MRNETRRKYNAYLSNVATLNGVDQATTKFAVEPTIQQKLETKMTESIAFLGMINVVGVTEAQGEKLGLSISGPIASNTDTSGNGKRQTRDLSSLDAQKYHCQKTNYDSHIRYAKIDMWAKFPDFQVKVSSAVTKQQGLDRIMIGFNGTSRAETSDIVANPLLQDVAVGWLQKYRDDKPESVMDEGVDASGVINVYEGGDYNNLDALVFDAVDELIAPWYQDGTDLVAIVGRKLLSDKYFPIINKNTESSETLAGQVIVSQKTLGNLPAIRVPFFPPNAILITTVDNLSIYFQEGARRRHLKDVPESDQIENYESSNDDYVVENYDLGCLIENINLDAPAV